MDAALILQAAIAVVMLAPPATVLTDVERFPPACISQQALAFNKSHALWLIDQSLLYPHRNDEFTELLCETRRLYYAWDCLNAANAGENNRDEAYRMRWLETLRDWLGEDDYQAGVMPPVVPARGFGYAR